MNPAAKITGNAKTPKRPAAWALACCLLLVFSLFSTAFAEDLDVYWLPQSGDWSDDLNWYHNKTGGNNKPGWNWHDCGRIENGGTATIYPGANEHIYGHWLGYSPGTSGTVEMLGGQFTVDGEEDQDIIGGYGTGRFEQSGGVHNAYPVLWIGRFSGSDGTYALSGTGELSVLTEIVGNLGTGRFEQSGGTNTLGHQLWVGNGSGSDGSYDLTGGTLRMTRTYDWQLVVGRYGTGTLNLGDAAGTGTINEIGSGNGVNMAVRLYNGATGTVRGWGTVGLTGTLQNNGRIIADGYGTDRTLDLSSLASVTNTIANTTTNGWFAQNHGKLVLPPIGVTTGSNSYNWGEDPSDITVDLVNAVRMAFTNVSSGGDFWIDLLAPDYSDVPDLGIGTGIGFWDFRPPDPFSFDSVNLTFRYDDAMAAAMGLIENELRLYHYFGGQWLDVTTGIDTTNHWLYANGITSFSAFGIGVDFPSAVPEPSSAALLLLGAGLFLRRQTGPTV